MFRRSLVCFVVAISFVLAGIAQSQSSPAEAKPGLQRVVSQAQQQEWGCRDAIRRAPDSPMVVRVSQGVISGNATTKIQPDTSGIVLSGHDNVYVQIVIDHDGNVACARVLAIPDMTASAELTNRSIDAAKRWKFKPYLLNGSPVYVDSVLWFSFVN